MAAKTPEQKLADLQQKMENLKKQEAAIKRAARAEDRKKDTRRKIIGGAWVVAMIDANPHFADAVLRDMPGFIKANPKTASADMELMKPIFDAAKKSAAKIKKPAKG